MIAEDWIKLEEDIAMRILYTGSGLPSTSFQIRPATYHKYQVSLKRRIFGPLNTNGSSGEYDNTGPLPSLVKVSPSSPLIATPIATLNGTDSQRVQPP